VKPTFWILGMVLVVAGTATALDVPFRDGTVITADSYKVTGSYVMIVLADGSQVAFDVADVDLAALRTAEAAAAAAAGEPAEPDPEQQSSDTISSGRTLKHADTAADDESAGLTITDHDVKHMHGSGVRGEDEQQEADAAGAENGPEGDYQVGGNVVLNNIRVNPAGEGRWQIQGEVVNRSPKPVLNVTVKLETMGGSEPWSGEVRVAAALGPDEKATFEHSFMAEVPEGKAQPSVRASVLWMQEESRREPDYTKAGGVPHPSNLPLQFGGVSGADVRPTPVQ
jgi:hypothetical protein